VKRFVPLRLKLTGLVALLLGVMAASCLVLLQRWMNTASQETAATRGVAVVRVLASALRPALDFDDPSDARRLLDLTAGPDVEYGEVRRADGSLLTVYIPAAGDGDPRKAQPGGLPLDFSVQEGKDFAFKALKDRVHVLARVEVPGEKEGERRVLGTLRVDFGLSALRQEQDDNLRVAGLVALLVVLLGSLLAYVLGNLLVAPVVRLTELTQAIAERGDLRQAILVESSDETGVLAARFHQMVQGQRALLAALRTSVEGVAEVIEAIGRAGGTVGKGAATVEAQLETTTRAMREVLQSADGVGRNVARLKQSTERSSTAIVKMVNANEGVAANVGTMAENVGQSARAIEQMADRVSRVAAAMAELDGAVRGTTGAVADIRSTIEEVQDNARLTNGLSSRAVADAEAGAKALYNTIDSMERIRDVATGAFQLLAGLGQSMQDIGGIVELINDLAHKTNLLALNAGIIAAHAGEHGAAFNVVAQEIKTLADRTRASTAEITTVIDRIKEESTRAGAAMQAGMATVDEGTRVGAAAGDALRKIEHSARESGRMVEAIALATEGEARQARAVAESFDRMHRNVQQVAANAAEQAADSQRLRVSTRDIHGLTQQVRASSQEQASGGRQVIDAMREIQDVVAVVEDAQGQQATAAQRALQAVEAIREVGARQNDSVQRLEMVIETLRRQTDELQAFMRRFQT
jgi:methyl-accepting chemotaxis protein